MASRQTAQAYSFDGITAEWAKFSKEASFQAGVHGYTNRRRRRDTYEWGGGDDAVEDGEGAEDPVLPRRRAVHALPPPRDFRRQGRRRRRHRRPARRQRSLFFQKERTGQNPKGPPLRPEIVRSRRESGGDGRRGFIRGTSRCRVAFVVPPQGGTGWCPAVLDTGHGSLALRTRAWINLPS